MSPSLDPDTNTNPDPNPNPYPKRTLLLPLTPPTHQVRKEMFFEAMKAVLAVQRDHGNREVR